MIYVMLISIIRLINLYRVKFGVTSNHPHRSSPYKGSLNYTSSATREQTKHHQTYAPRPHWNQHHQNTKKDNGPAKKPLPPPRNPLPNTHLLAEIHQHSRQKPIPPPPPLANLQQTDPRPPSQDDPRRSRRHLRRLGGREAGGEWC